MRILKALPLAALVLGLSACASGPTWADRTVARVSTMADMGDRIGDSVTKKAEATICPPGMVAVFETFNEDQRAETRYTEMYGQFGGGAFVPGVSALPVPPAANGRLDIFVDTRKERRATCQKPQR